MRDDDPAGRPGPPRPSRTSERTEPAEQAPAGYAPPPGLDQAFDRNSLYALRAAIAAHASAAGLTQAQVYDMVVAVHELATNAIRHGAGHGRVRLWHQDGAVYGEVSDDGPVPGTLATETPPDAGKAWPWAAEHGHGLWLVREVTDRVTVRSGPGGTVATVCFTLPGAG